MLAWLSRRPDVPSGRAHRSGSTVALGVQQLEARDVPAAHFNGDPVISNPTTDSLNVQGQIVGLGNTDSVSVVVSADVTADVALKNPGGKIVPGKSGTQTLSAQQDFTSIQNGQVTFDVTLNFSASVQLPNPKWQAIVTNVSWTNVMVTATIVNQGGTSYLTWP